MIPDYSPDDGWHSYLSSSIHYNQSLYRKQSRSRKMPVKYISFIQQPKVKGKGLGEAKSQDGV